MVEAAPLPRSRSRVGWRWAAAAGGAIAAFCFFLPWGRFSFLAVHRSAAGHTMGGATWVIFALAVVVAVAGLVSLRDQRPILPRLVLLGASLVGLGCFFWKMNEITRGFWTPFGHIRPQDLGVKPGPGCYGTAGGFLIAVVALLLAELPVAGPVRQRRTRGTSPAGGGADTT